MNALAISGLTIIITCFPLSLLILLRSERGPLHRLWAVFNIAVGVWGLGTCGVGLSRTAEASLLWWKIAHLGGIFLGVIFFHLVTRFCRLQRSALIIGVYVYAVFFSAVVIAGIAVSSPRLLFESLYYNTTNPLHASLVAIWVVIVAMTHYDLIRGLRSAKGHTRQQIKYFLTGMAVGFTGGTTVLLPMFYVPVYPLGNFSIPLYCLIVTYAIVRYRLLEINLVLTRGAIFISIYAFALGLPFLLAMTGEKLLESFFGRQWWGIPLALMALLATVGHYVNLFFQRKAEAHLLREQRRYQAVLLNAAKGMTQIHDLRRLLKLLTYLPVRHMKLSHAGIFLWDDSRDQYILRVQVQPPCKVTNSPVEFGTHEPLVLWLMDQRTPVVQEEISQLAGSQHSRTISWGRLESRLKRLEAAVVVPSFVNGRLIGFLTLGPKRTGTVYSDDDLNMLQTLANQAALAIENAQFYEKEQERQAELFHAASIADLGTMATNMSHQLNNPFCVIAGNAQMREENLRLLLKRNAELPDSMRQVLQQEIELLQSLQEEATKGANIIATIRGITEPKDDDRPLAIAEALSAALPVAHHKIPFTRFELRQELPDDLPKIWGKKAQLAQCLLSLIANAWDAIRTRQEEYKPYKLPPPPSDYRGLIRVAASTITETDPATRKPTQWIALMISDNGVGVKPEDIRKLFIPYFTKKPTTVKAQGSLFMVRRMIEAHGGTITVDSTFGTGTTFKVRLPVLTDEEAKRREAEQRALTNGQ